VFHHCWALTGLSHDLTRLASVPGKIGKHGSAAKYGIHVPLAQPNDRKNGFIPEE
jgi:hypothetical protein